MAVKITQKYDRIQPVSFITKARAKFITLADKVANASPFAVKSEDGMAGQYIQAIILPNGQKIEDLEQIYDPELLKTLKWDRAEKGETLTKYIQVEEDAFDPESLTTVPIGETGQMIVGELTQAAKADLVEYGPGSGRGAVTPVPGQNTWGKTGYWERSADGNIPRYAVPETFSDTVQQKISAMTGAIRGAVELESDPKKRKTQCVNAVKAFQDWLAGALETMGADAEKADLENQIMELVKNSLPGGVTDNNSIAQKSDNGGIDKMDANEIKRLVADSLKETVPGMISQALKADKEAAENLAAEQAKKEEYDALKKDIADLKAQLAEDKKSEGEGEAAKTDDPEKLREEITALKSELAGALDKFRAIESSPLIAPSQGDNSRALKSEPDPDDVFNDLAVPAIN